MVISEANTQPNVKYYINVDYDGNNFNTPDLTITPVVTTTISKTTCPLVATLEVWNTTLHIWKPTTVANWISSFNAVTGILVVGTNVLT